VGNVFIFGHSSNFPWVKSEYNDVFALLDTLKNGDEVIIFYNQKKYTYKITDRAIVKPGDVKVLNSRDHSKKELSLMTCWPIGTVLERIILFAELVE
jgi:LPXTG-site transpeptidase (sortase) family protein